VRAVVLGCPPGVCEAGHCVRGNEGPVCGRCKAGHAKARHTCSACSEQDENDAKVAMWVVCPIICLILWGFLSWRPLIADFLSPRIRRDGNTHPTGGSGRSGALVWRQLADWRAIATIVIACFQILASLYLQYDVRWTRGVENTMQYFPVANVDISSLPVLHCLWRDVTFRQKLFVGTLAPLSALLIHAVPSNLYSLFERVRGSSSAREEMRRMMRERFYNSLVIFIIIIYPIASTISMRPFHCHPELELVADDFSIRCPRLSDSLELYWGALFTLLYPIGIPACLFALLVFFKVPALAHRKQQDALVEALWQLTVHRFREKMRECSQQSSTSTGQSTGWNRAQPLQTVTITGSAASTSLSSATLSSRRGGSNSRNGSESPGWSGGGSGSEMLVDLKAVLESYAQRVMFTSKKSGSAGNSSAFAAAANDDDEILNHIATSLLLTGTRAALFAFYDMVTALVPEATLVRTEGSSWSAWFGVNDAGQKLLELDNVSNADLRRWIAGVGAKMKALGKLTVHDKGWDEETAEERQAVAHIGPCFVQYKVQFWYWELVEMSRKLLLVAIIPMLINSAQAQITVAMFTSLLAFSACIWGFPYRSSYPNLLQSYVQFTLFCTLYYGQQLLGCEDPSDCGYLSDLQGPLIALQTLAFLHPSLKFLTVLVLVLQRKLKPRAL